MPSSAIQKAMNFEEQETSATDSPNLDNQSLDAIREANLLPASGVLAFATKDLTAEALRFSVLNHRLVKPFPVIPILAGFLPFEGDDEGLAPTYLLEVDDYIVLRLAELSRQVPRAAITRHSREVIEDAEKKAGGSLDASEINMLHGNAVVDLLKKALVQEQESLVLYQASTGMIFISGRGHPGAEASRTRLNHFTPGLVSTHWRNPEPLRLVMTTWLRCGQLPEGFSFGTRSRFTAPGGISTSIQKQNLRAKQILDLLNKGQRVTEIELVYDGRMSLILCEKEFIKGIKLLQKPDIRNLTGPSRAVARLMPYAQALFEASSALVEACASTDIDVVEVAEGEEGNE